MRDFLKVARVPHPFRLIKMALCAFVCAGLAGCGVHDDVMVIRLGHGMDVSDPAHRAMVNMADLLAEKSAGSMRIEIYPNGQLGSERECIELVQIGALGMSKTSTSVMEGFVPVYRLLSLPYLLRDDAHKFAVLEGEIGRRLLVATEDFRMRGVVFYDAGSRSFYTKSKPILHPDDLAGLKIRTQESASSIRMIQLMGGSATPISWGELYTALQQGVVDGAENNLPSFLSGAHYEVCPYFSLDEHTSVPDLVLINIDLWRSLTPQQQEWIQEAADESAQYMKEIWALATEEARRFVEARGVQIFYPDKEPFRARVAPMYETFERDPELREWLRQIENAL